MVRRTDDTLRCSFCGKSQNEVKKLIAGPTVFICNECVDICNEIIVDDELEPDGSLKPAEPSPTEPVEEIPRYLERAKDELDAARVLLDREHYRVSVEVARAAARSAL